MTDEPFGITALACIASVPGVFICRGRERGSSAAAASSSKRLRRIYRAQHKPASLTLCLQPPANKANISFKKVFVEASCTWTSRSQRAEPTLSGGVATHQDETNVAGNLIGEKTGSELS